MEFFQKRVLRGIAVVSIISLLTQTSLPFFEGVLVARAQEESASETVELEDVSDTVEEEAEENLEEDEDSQEDLSSDDSSDGNASEDTVENGGVESSEGELTEDNAFDVESGEENTDEYEETTDEVSENTDGKDSIDTSSEEGEETEEG